MSEINTLKRLQLSWDEGLQDDVVLMALGEMESLKSIKVFGKRFSPREKEILRGSMCAPMGETEGSNKELQIKDESDIGLGSRKGLAAGTGTFVGK